MAKEKSILDTTPHLVGGFLFPNNLALSPLGLRLRIQHIQ